MKKPLNILLYIAAGIVCTTAYSFAFYFFFWQAIVGSLLMLLGISCSYLWKFVKMIMVLEDDLGQTTQALEEVEGSMQNIIDMKLYFDTPEVQEMVSHVMDSVKMAKFSVNKMIKNLTDRSKQKYIMIIEKNPDGGDEHPHAAGGIEENSFQQQQLLLRTREGAQQEGTIASVERSKI